MRKPKNKPESPNFSSGPTKKPDSWSINKLNLDVLSRYHRSQFILNFINKTFEDLRQILCIPKNYKIFLSPGSCTGAMQSILWSLLGKRKVTSIVYDFWGEYWSQDIKKIGVSQEVRKSLNGQMPNFSKVNLNNDLFFVWGGTSTGMSVNNLNWISDKQKGLVLSDVTSAVFINNIEWRKLDAAVFSWQKALGSESQHGIIVMSPKAIKRSMKNKDKILPSVLDLNNRQELINTPSLLSFSDFNFCLSWFKKKGGISWAKKICSENKSVLDKWEENNKYIKYFSKQKKYRSLSACYFTFRYKVSKEKLKKIFLFLELENIAYDIKSYRKAPLGIRIWIGPTILKKDLISLTKWLDWCFYKYIEQ